MHSRREALHASKEQNIPAYLRQARPSLVSVRCEIRAQVTRQVCAGGGLLGNCKTLRGSPEVFRWVGTLERRFQEMRSTPWECLAIESQSTGARPKKVIENPVNGATRWALDRRTPLLGQQSGMRCGSRLSCSCYISLNVAYVAFSLFLPTPPTPRAHLAHLLRLPPTTPLAPPTRPRLPPYPTCPTYPTEPTTQRRLPWSS